MAGLARRRRRAPLAEQWQGVVLSRSERNADGRRGQDQPRIRTGFPQCTISYPSPATDLRDGFFFLRRDCGRTEISGQYESGCIQFGALVSDSELVCGDGEVTRRGAPWLHTLL